MNNFNEGPAMSKKEQNFTPIIFSYEGQEIGFKTINGVVMVNATQMGKNFNKRPADWTRLKATDEYVNALKISQNADVRNGLFDEEEKPLVQVVNGGNNQGTWMQEDLALEFARWLNPFFAIWCNKHIKQLLLKGATSIKQEQKGYPALPPKRNHNRITDKRAVSIMKTICKIEDEVIRMELIKKIGL